MSILRYLIKPQFPIDVTYHCSYGNGPGFRNLMTDGKGNYTKIDRSNVTLRVDESAPLKFRQVVLLST